MFIITHLYTRQPLCSSHMLCTTCFGYTVIGIHVYELPNMNLMFLVATYSLRVAKLMVDKCQQLFTYRHSESNPLNRVHLQWSLRFMFLLSSGELSCWTSIGLVGPCWGRVYNSVTLLTENDWYISRLSRNQ